MVDNIDLKWRAFLAGYTKSNNLSNLAVRYVGGPLDGSIAKLVAIDYTGTRPQDKNDPYYLRLKLQRNQSKRTCSIRVNRVLHSSKGKTPIFKHLGAKLELLENYTGEPKVINNSVIFKDNLGADIKVGMLLFYGGIAKVVKITPSKVHIKWITGYPNQDYRFSETKHCLVLSPDVVDRVLKAQLSN